MQSLIIIVTLLLIGIVSFYTGYSIGYNDCLEDTLPYEEIKTSLEELRNKLNDSQETTVSKKETVEEKKKLDEFEQINELFNYQQKSKKKSGDSE